MQLLNRERRYILLKNLDASGFYPAPHFYEGEFECILIGITNCYQMMIDDKVQVPNDENQIRDILLINYLKKREIRNKLGFTDNYGFDREVPEDNDIGRSDIKVTTRNTLTEQDAYYIIECKRLDNQNLTGISGLNADYIKEGIMRFIIRKYSAFYGINGMIGFVVKNMDIHKNIININTLLKNHFASANTDVFLTKGKYIDDFEYQYFSLHYDVKNNLLKLYHLMFDFSSQTRS